MAPIGTFSLVTLYLRDTPMEIWEIVGYICRIRSSH